MVKRPQTPPPPPPSADQDGWTPGEVLRDGRPLKDEAFEQAIADDEPADEDGWISGGVFRDGRPLKDEAFESADPRIIKILAEHPELLVPGMKADAWVPLAVRAMSQLKGQKARGYREQLAKLSAAAGQGPEGKGFAPDTIRDAIKKPSRKRHKPNKRF
jgi:hypothetical protein